MMRRVGDVRCITIVHPLQEIRKYREYSAFFRLLGIFVCEKISGDEFGDPTDYSIVLSDGEDWSEDISFFNIVDKMFVDEVISLSMKQAFQQAYDIFQNNDLMRASYAIAYFFNAQDDYIYGQMYEAYDKFNTALTQFEILESKLENLDELKYIWAAKSNCRRRMNELYTIIWEAINKGWYGNSEEEKQGHKEKLWKKKYFEYEEVNEDIKKILDFEPDFYGAYAIRGFASELDPKRRFDSVSDLLSVVNCIGKRSYASYVYYRIGKYCESIRGNMKERWSFYQLAWALDPKNYRALYKLALKEKGEGKLDTASELCSKLIEILKSKEQSRALQPIECAYLFKTYIIWGDICVSNGKLLSGISCFQKAEEIYGSHFNEDREKGFYPWMFKRQLIESQNKKERWEIYKNAAKEKLKIKILYRKIANAAADAGDKNLYDKYYPLSRDEKLF